MKIARSIVVSVLIICVVVSVLSGVYEVISGGHKYESMLFPFMIAGPLLLIFGLPGSLIWWAVARFFSDNTYKYIYAVATACVLVTVVVAVAISRLELDIFLKALAIVVFVIPVAALSLIIYKRGKGSSQLVENDR